MNDRAVRVAAFAFAARSLALGGSA